MKRLLGRTRVETFPLGLGGHTYPIGNDPGCFVTPEDRARLVKQLVDGGVNYFDTTWLNEAEQLADSFKRACVGKQAAVSLQYVDGISDARWREKLRHEVEVRLKVMGYTRAPLFIMGIGNNKPSLGEIIAALEAMARLRDAGLVENIGVSCHELSHFPVLVQAIEQTDLVDYMMIRFNYKFQQAGEELFDVARQRNIGVVAMKVFCWDCGPNQWDRRISVFEPVPEGDRYTDSSGLTPAQKSLVWTLQNSPAAVAVPAINAVWEADECLNAVGSLGLDIDIPEFVHYVDRLWRETDLSSLAERAESQAIRDRARALLRN
jgi:aryl-alcohol dehydrogenase-like predicted oxidoreductase